MDVDKIQLNGGIPKIIHLCWLSGDRYPHKIRRCIESWRRVLPDYEIMLWDTNRFDINSQVWVKEAFEKKKYAFAADYIRFYALYNYGGFYLDSDVEVLRSFDDLLNLPLVIGYEFARYFEAATIGAVTHHPLMQIMLDYYEGRHFVNSDGSMNTVILPVVMRQVYRQNGCIIKEISSIQDYDKSDKIINVFPNDWFSPIETKNRLVLKLTQNTYSIHHFANAWVGLPIKILNAIFGRSSKTKFFILDLWNLKHKLVMRLGK